MVTNMIITDQFRCQENYRIIVNCFLILFVIKLNNIENMWK
jgi:hypothetical protein